MEKTELARFDALAKRKPNGAMQPQSHVTEEMARRRALEFARERQLPVSKVTAVRRLCLQHPTKGVRDFWVVCLAMETPEGLAEYGREIIVEIRADTGETTVFSSGQREES